MEDAELYEFQEKSTLHMRVDRVSVKRQLLQLFFHLCNIRREVAKDTTCNRLHVLHPCIIQPAETEEHWVSTAGSERSFLSFLPSRDERKARKWECNQELFARFLLPSQGLKRKKKENKRRKSYLSLGNLLFSFTRL